jgi:hypothetical protein
VTGSETVPASPTSDDTFFNMTLVMEDRQDEFVSWMITMSG